MQRSLIALGFLTIIAVMLASSVSLTGQVIWCGTLPGCPPSGEVDLSTTAPTDWSFPLMMQVAQSVLVYAQLIGELFLAIGALYMLLNLGNDERITKGKNMVIWSLVGIALALFAEEFVVVYLATETYVDVGAGADLIEDIIAAFIRIVRTFFTVALFVAVVYNAFRMVLSRGNDEEYAKAKSGFFWAAIGAVIVNVASRLAESIAGLPI